ncbi:hypothetical protein KAX02_00425 [candidate division WOR-3 bacterium]|nr:hypothetical protein [candidate division WOR-3 bacterium]
MNSHKHIGCGGSLEFHHDETVKVSTSRGQKEIRKSLFLCDKCGDMVNCIQFPSYEEYVLRGQIWVTPSEYYRIKKLWGKTND